MESCPGESHPQASRRPFEQARRRLILRTLSGPAGAVKVRAHTDLAHIVSLLFDPANQAVSKASTRTMLPLSPMAHLNSLTTRLFRLRIYLSLCPRDKETRPCSRRHGDVPQQFQVRGVLIAVACLDISRSHCPTFTIPPVGREAPEQPLLVRSRRRPPASLLAGWKPGLSGLWGLRWAAVVSRIASLQHRPQPDASLFPA